MPPLPRWISRELRHRPYLRHNERAVGQWVHFILEGRAPQPGPQTSDALRFHDIHDSLARFKVDHLDLYLLTAMIRVPVQRCTRPGRPDRSTLTNLHCLCRRALTPFVISSPQAWPCKVAPWVDCESLSGPAGGPARALCRQNGVTLFVWSSPADSSAASRHADRMLRSTRGQGLFCIEENFKRTGAGSWPPATVPHCPGLCLQPACTRSPARARPKERRGHRNLGTDELTTRYEEGDTKTAQGRFLRTQFLCPREVRVARRLLLNLSSATLRYDGLSLVDSRGREYRHFGEQLEFIDDEVECPPSRLPPGPYSVKRRKTEPPGRKGALLPKASPGS